MLCGDVDTIPLSTSNPPAVQKYLFALLETMYSIDIPHTHSGASSSSALSVVPSRVGCGFISGLVQAGLFNW